MLVLHIGDANLAQAAKRACVVEHGAGRFGVDMHLYDTVVTDDHRRVAQGSDASPHLIKSPPTTYKQKIRAVAVFSMFDMDTTRYGLLHCGVAIHRFNLQQIRSPHLRYNGAFRQGAPIIPGRRRPLRPHRAAYPGA